MPLSKAEHQAYLQKYLSAKSSSAEPTKKKRRKEAANGKARAGVRVVDDDVDFGSIGYGKEELYEEEADEKPLLDVSDGDEDEAAARLAAIESFKGEGHRGTAFAGQRDTRQPRERRDSPDASPPRRRERRDSPDAIPPRRRERHDSPDASPSQRRERHDSPDANPQRRQRHDSPDASPPRRRERHASPDASPPRRQARPASPVASLPRRRERHDSPDASPPRRRERHDSTAASPLRRSAPHDSPDASPPRRHGRHDSPDASPPRRQARRDSPDASPPRRRERHDAADASPQRRRERRDSPDASPPRRRRGDAAGDASPPRRQAKEDRSVARPSAGAQERLPSLTGPTGGAARSFCKPGLHTNVSAEVADLKSSQATQLQSADPAALGAGADTVRRDRHGRKLEGLNAMLEMEKAGAGGSKPMKPVWGKGLAQERSKKEQLAHEREWANKPLALYEDNADRDAAKRAVERWGDPMAGRLSMDKAKAKSTRPKYVGPPAPPNRFNIPPGHKWDGVDRSNGYEKQFFMAQADARAKADLAFQWAVEDM